MSEPRFDPAKVTIHPGVKLGRDVVIHDFCVIGIPPRGRQAGELPTVIGDGSVIRPFTTIYAGVRTGRKFRTGQGASIRENNVIGEDTSVGTLCILEVGNRIGNHVRIHGGSGFEHTTIEDHVIIGPNVFGVSDPHPACPRYLECVLGPTIKRYSRIGGSVVLNPGAVVGENSLVGSGTVVNGEVPPNTVFFGHPGKPRRRIETLECFKGFYSRAYEWDPPELFDASLFPKPKA